MICAEHAAKYNPRAAGGRTATSDYCHPSPKSARRPAVRLHTSLPFSAGCSLQTAHLRPQLRLGPCHKGWPSDPGNLHPEPPHQEHQRCQLVPDHHSTESGQSEIRCVESSGAQGLCTSPKGRSISCRSCGRFRALFLERCLSLVFPPGEASWLPSGPCSAHVKLFNPRMALLFCSLALFSVTASGHPSVP